MKEKTENLIKKVEVKEQLKQDFIELLTGCTISFDCEDIDYSENGNLVCYYHKPDNNFMFRYDILAGFELKFNLSYEELNKLLKTIVREVLHVAPIEIKWIEWFEEV